MITRDVLEFSERAGAFLREALERNVLATVLGTITERGGYGAEAPLFAYHTDGRDRLTAAALRTPPWPLLASEFDDPDLAAELVQRWIALDPLIPGVSGEPGTARAISATWAQQTGGLARCEFVEAMHVLTAVKPPPRPARGQLRGATQEDRALLIEWERAFTRETGLGNGDNAERFVDRRLAHDLQLVWEDRQPVSTLGFNPAVAGTVRIGPVYTPREHRDHGYATSATAAASQLLLDRGAERCMLFTDLTNPVSNSIYAAIGYVRCGDWEQHGFDGPSQP